MCLPAIDGELLKELYARRVKRMPAEKPLTDDIPDGFWERFLGDLNDSEEEDYDF